MSSGLAAPPFAGMNPELGSSGGTNGAGPENVCRDTRQNEEVYMRKILLASAAMLTQDMSTLGGRIGVLFAGNAIACLIGNPAAGTIQRTTASGWRGLAIYCAVLNVVGGCLLAVCWTFNVRRKKSSFQPDRIQ